MRKKRLMELKPLKVMNRHIADAKKTEISLSPLEKQRGEPGKYRMYCRAAVEKGILKVYLFAVTDIEENINFPRYRLFISRKERRFITYDEKLKKWRKALLESILWDVRTNLGNIYVNGCDTKIIQKYLKTIQPAIRALEEFQANIRKEQRIRHDKKLTDSWDQVMKTVSGLPKNWIGWVSKYGITEHYIFYKYQKNGATEGYCTYCKKHVPIRSPKYNQKGRCNVCGQPITFRSVGKSGRFCTKWYRVYLIQRRRKTSGFVLRIFHARTWYKRGGYTDCETTCHEEQRRIFSANGKEISNFVYGLFKQREMRWISYGEPWYYTCCGIQYKGMVYPYTLSDLSRHELKETGLREYALGQKKIDPGKYLYLWKTYPVLEQIVKTGLFQLVDDVLDYRTTDAIKRKGRKPTEFLSVNKKEFRRLRDMNGGVKELKWLQLEKSTGKTIGDEEICWMVKEGFEPNDLKFVLDQMSICQIRHYLVKQSEKSGDDISHVLQVWNDYLSMAKRLGMDIHDSIIYRTRDLQLRHKEAVLKIEEMKRGIRRRELEEKYMEGCVPKEVTKKEEIPENQVMSKERHRAKEAFFYEGNKYISLGQCCEFYGINESSVRSRTWRKKCTWEEAVKYYIQKKETETPKMQFFYKGKRYKSVSACCAEYGVNASSVRNRAKTTECSIEESLDHFIKKARMETQPSVFIFRDKTYRSLEECCLEYGVNADSVSSRKYRLNCTMEESLEHFIENKDMIAERIQKFTFKGIEYRSLRACCQKYGIDDICVRQRARDKNCSLEESFTHFMTRKRKKMLSNPEFEYHGTVYPSLKVCCEELGINKSSVISRSHRAGCSLQEAVEYYVSQQERRT